MPLSQAQARSIFFWPSVLWLNFCFWILFFIWTFLLAFIAIPYQWLFARITGDRRHADWLIRRTISNYGTVVIYSGWPLVRVKYVDLAPEEKPPFVFVSNHRSASDAYLMAFLPIEAVQVLNIWPLRLPLVNYLSRTAGYLRVREMPFEQFLSDGARLLSQGVSIVAFPEGTRSRSGNLGPFHGSAFRLAQQTGVKICPVAISGNQEIPPRGSLLLRPGRIVVTKLPSVSRDQYDQLKPYILKAQVREAIHRHLEAHPA